MSDLSHLGGWIDDPKGVAASMEKLPYPVFSDIWSSIKGSGKGKKMLLHEIVKNVAGYFPVRRQEDSDCVSMGLAGAVDIIKCVDIHINKDFEMWVAETSTEDIYCGSRNIIGKGRLGNGGGSLGVWAAEYVNKYGALARGKYGSIDLSKYDVSKVRSWARPGFVLPDDILNAAKQHPVLTISQVNSYEEVRDLIVNGYAVTIACNQGFSSKRDSEGFARPEGSWAHQQYICAVDDEYKRPGGLVMNSWGAWNSGPKRHNQPDGSYWVDAEELERRVLKTGDCWAISGYEGFKPQKLNTRII